MLPLSLIVWAVKEIHRIFKTLNQLVVGSIPTRPTIYPDRERRQAATSAYCRLSPGVVRMPDASASKALLSR
jgi:hypothetical protein